MLVTDKIKDEGEEVSWNGMISEKYGKFLWEFSIYSKIWPTNTPKGEQAFAQNELLRTKL